MIKTQAGGNAVEFDRVCFSYDGGEVIRDATFSVNQLEFASVVGPNGSGKSTLVKLMLGLLKPTSGQVRVFGLKPEEALTRIGYLPQRADLDPQFPATVMDVVLMGRARKGNFIGPYARRDKEAAQMALSLVGLPDVARRPFSDLSGGQRQRVLTARALSTEPDLLVMDEPTAGLDAWAEANLYSLLEELNRTKTIIMVSHDIGMVSRRVDSVICVSCDVTVHPTSELTGEMINRLYGGDMKMIRHDHRCAGEGHECRNS